MIDSHEPFVGVVIENGLDLRRCNRRRVPVPTTETETDFVRLLRHLEQTNDSLGISVREIRTVQFNFFLVGGFDLKRFFTFYKTWDVRNVCIIGPCGVFNNFGLSADVYQINYQMCFLTFVLILPTLY